MGVVELTSGGAESQSTFGAEFCSNMNFDRYPTVTKTIFDTCWMTFNFMEHVLCIRWQFRHSGSESSPIFPNWVHLDPCLQ